jgi:hypothetical protein
MKTAYLLKPWKFMVASGLYYLIKFGLAPSLISAKYERYVEGTCVILAPPGPLSTIKEGLHALRALDPTIFQELTVKRRFIFWYHASKYLNAREVFTITDNFLRWGANGVIACFVQAVFDTSSCAQTRNQMQQCVFNHLKKYSLPPELLKQYEVFAMEK